MSEHAVEVHDVWKTYQLGDTTVDALRGINLEVEPGEFAALLGPSGSGKSSLLHLIGAMDHPCRGNIKLNGRDIAKLSAPEQAALRLNQIGFVFQTFNLMPTLTALENVELPMRLAGVGRRERTERASALLERVGLADRASHVPRQLSGGQRQRVAVARALANGPDLILADEPTGNLDSGAGQAIMQLLRAANDEGVSVVLVTHNTDLVENTGRVITIRDGRVESDSSVDSRAGDLTSRPTSGSQKPGQASQSFI